MTEHGNTEVPRSEDTSMLRLLLDGSSYEEVAAEYALSRERIRQRMADRGWIDTINAERVRRLERIRHDREQAEATYVANRKYDTTHGPTLGRTEWPEDAIVAAVKDWMKAGGSGKASDFPGPPSSALICQRLGWNRALELAGYTPARRKKRHRADRVANDELLNHVIAFLADPDTRRGSANEYEAWAPTYGGASMTTIRTRFGSWIDAKALAMTRMPAERGTA